MSEEDKPIVWSHGEVKTPPFTPAARFETGLLLRRLQQGENIGLPHCRPMPSIGRRCYELRVRDESNHWRVMIRLDDDAIVVAEVFNKTTRETPQSVIENCQRRLNKFDGDSEEKTT